MTDDLERFAIRAGCLTPAGTPAQVAMMRAAYLWAMGSLERIGARRASGRTVTPALLAGEALDAVRVRGVTPASTFKFCLTAEIEMVMAIRSERAVRLNVEDEYALPQIDRAHHLRWRLEKGVRRVAQCEIGAYDFGRDLRVVADVAFAGPRVVGHNASRRGSHHYGYRARASGATLRVDVDVHWYSRVYLRGITHVEIRGRRHFVLGADWRSNGSVGIEHLFASNTRSGLRCGKRKAVIVDGHVHPDARPEEKEEAA